MRLGLLAIKQCMTNVFTNNGVMITVTILKALPNIVVGKKTIKLNGYNALQVGYGTIRQKLLNKCQIGFFKRIGVSPTRYLKEFRIDEFSLTKYSIGTEINIDIFRGISSLDASSISNGKGFQGVMKRYGFKGSDATHGTHESFRGGGSIGQCTNPSRVFKGKKMPGQMGNIRITTKNLRIIKILVDEKIVCLRGAIPGHNGSLVELRISNRKPNNISGIFKKN